MDSSIISGNELLQVADVVAREKAIDREEVLIAMEMAIQKAGRSRYGQDRDIRAMIDRKSGQITLEQFTEVVDIIEDEVTQTTLEDAKKIDSSLDIGSFIRETLPPLEFGRIAAQTAKQVISQRVREAERARQFEEYKGREGEIVIGTVKRAENYMITVDLGRAEAVIRREDMIPKEIIKQGDRIRAQIKEVREELRGPQIFLTRAGDQFMAALFTQEVPEIYDGIIEIKGVVREPGSRAKMSVYSHDPSIHPVGSCVGMRGSRVQAVVNELHGEKIEIIPWSEDIVSFAINALAPAEVAKVVVHQDEGRLEVIVPNDQLSLAIGRRGQNVRLASQLTGWYIDILSQSEEYERFQERSESFMEQLDIDDVIASLLVAEGFIGIDDIAESDVEELMSIQGFDEGIAEELWNRAVDFVERENTRINAEMAQFTVANDLIEFSMTTPAMILTLAKNGILTLNDLADLDIDEVVKYLGEHGVTSEEKAGEIIMEARKHWFDDEPEDAADAPDAPDSDADGDTATDVESEVAPD
ncbi:MAG: transcription termination/antitermination protein NusA [Alphaproteobacteria bacterium]|nr:transcription termination/antitermination protein NusA [Alphaproteobacteria bacterium]